MTEAERKSFFAHSSQRAVGKRQIKPTAAMAELTLPADDDEDDEDFKAEGLSGSDSSGTSSEEEDEEEEENEDAEGGVFDEDIHHDPHGLLLAVSDAINNGPVCSLCLNLRKAATNEEVIQCDKCGVVVHEGCYVVDVSDADDKSIESSCSTEPWFCEPCVYGEGEPPHCELCPSRYGAFKRSDIGGRWVHLVCALYTPSITFGDVDRLSAVSWQEMDYKLFGRKACHGCSNRLEARTGVVSGCDAALCKNFYHITCAQRLGLLEDRSDADELEGDVGRDTRLIHCKKHSHEEEVRVRREAYARFVRQEERRMVSYGRRKKLSEREEEKLKKQLERSKKAHEALIGQTISWPDASWDQSDKKFRRARLLHTSAHFLDAFAEKAELANVHRDDFEKTFIKVNAEQLPFLAPGFSSEFIAYFENREKHVHGAEMSRLDRLQKENAGLKERQNDLEREYKQLESVHSSARDSADSVQARFSRLHSALSALGVKKLPRLPEPSPTRKNSSRRHSMSKGSAVKPERGTLSPVAKQRATLHECDTCNLTTNQHLLVECDACKKYFHLGCLDPPLDRMPKKVNFEWHCSNCVEDSDEEEGESGERDAPSPEIDDGDSNQSAPQRKLRQRSDSVRARKLLEAEDQHRAYRSAIARGSRQVKKEKEEGSRPPSAASQLRSKKGGTAPIPPLRVNTSDRGSRSSGVMSPSASSGSHSPTAKKARLALSPSSGRKGSGRAALQEVPQMEDEEDEQEKIIIYRE